MELRAISLGYAVPPQGFEGTVHSVFEEAVNLRLRGEDFLVTLVTKEGADLPQGIRLETPPGYGFAGRLHEGERMLSASGILKSEDGCLEINLRTAKRRKCTLPCLDEITPPVASAWNSAWCVLNEQQRHTEAEICAGEIFQMVVPRRTELAGKMSFFIRQLVTDTHRLDLSAKSSLAGLIGLGTGLTPGGDDFLVGFVTGLRVTTGRSRERKLLISELGKAIIRLSNRTNDISRTYLFHAAHGKVSSRLVTLANLISRGEDATLISQASKSVMQSGHTSGMETLTGLLIGMSVWGRGLQIN